MDVLRLLNVTGGVGGVAMKTIIIPIALLTLVAVQGNANAANNNTQRHSQSATNAIPVTQAPLLHGAVRHHTTLASNRYAQNKRYTKQRVRYAGRVFIFDPRRHRWYAYSNGRLIASGVAAGGAGYCRDVKRSCRTPVGHFRISRKGGANCRSGTSRNRFNIFCLAQFYKVINSCNGIYICKSKYSHTQMRSNLDKML